MKQRGVGTRAFGVVGVIAVSVLMVASCGSPSGSVRVDAPPIVQAPPDEVTPVVATALDAPRPVLGADNRWHLAYELFATNPTSAAMEITKVETLDGSSNAVLATVQGAALEDAIRPLVTARDDTEDPAAPEPEPDDTVGPAQTTRVILDLALAKNARIPTAIAHRFTLTLDASPELTVVTGRTGVVDEDAIEVGPPLEGGRWLVGGGCCFPPSYHRTATLPVHGAFHAPERFAIDYVQLNANNRLFNGARSQLSNYGYYGAKILSVADGVVVGLLDDQPEQTPPNFPADATAATAGGNYLVIDIGHGHFAFYAHMQRHSLRVHLGDKVHEGEVLGLLGNTGNSDGPHLHFHIMNGPTPLGFAGLPFVIKSFKSEGTITSDIDTLLGGAPAVVGPSLAGKHRKQMPLQNEVVSF